MRPAYELKIDAYSHIIPPRYREALYKIAPKKCIGKVDPIPTLFDLDTRFRIMDRYGELLQVLTLAWPTAEEVGDANTATELAKIANDSLAELVNKYPDRFVAAIACLPMNDMDAALREADRAINELSFRGVQINTPIQDKPLDSPEFWPLYEMLAKENLPLFIHPGREIDYPDYRTEERSKYQIFAVFGWPYETTVAMARLVYSGVFEKYPNLKVITHHCGGMVPYFANRIAELQDLIEMRRNAKHRQGLTRPAIDYFKQFYGDTALYGNTSALMCGYDFFGPDHVLFGADIPLGDSQLGFRNYRETINAIEAMEISDADKRKIFSENAKKLMRLPI